MESTLVKKTHVNCFDAFEQNGVMVLKKLLTNKQLEIIQKEVDHIRQTVLAKISTMARPIRTYTDIAERELGRLDYRCGFHSPEFDKIAEPIISVVKQLSPDVDFHHYWGAIPALGGSGPTNWHRDVYSVVNNMQGQNLSDFDINLPPYYFTVLIPLVQITNENGPTQFIKGTHKQMEVNIEERSAYSPLLSPGDISIFDGRIIHKGSANHTKDERLVAYITFVANWYHDQTFTVNDYLFPELAAGKIVASMQV